MARSFGGALKLSKRAQWFLSLLQISTVVQGRFIEFIALFDFEIRLVSINGLSLRSVRQPNQRVIGSRAWVREPRTGTSVVK